MDHIDIIERTLRSVINGHDSLGTTMVYVRATQGDLQRAVDEIAWA